MHRPYSFETDGPNPTMAVARAWVKVRSFLVQRWKLSAGGSLALAALAFFAFRGGPAVDQPLVLYKVSRGDLPIILTERGNLESQIQTQIRCEVEALNYNSNSGGGTQIIFIVPNGKAVTQGELLVELDSAPLRERLDAQVLAFEKAKAEQIQANAKFENQKTQNLTMEAEAQLKVDLADLNVKMYGDDADGTYKISLQELDLKIQEAKNQIEEALAALSMQATERDGMEMLYELGYRGRGDLDQARFKYLQAEDTLVRATNTLSNAVSAKRKLEQYENPMKIKELAGALETARRGLAQVKVDNVSLLAQAEAAKNAADNALQKEKEKLDKYNELLAKCKICAPHDGMAVYALDEDRRSSSTSISEGVYVRERQRILTLPNLATMQVKTTVHESMLDQVHAGLPATVKIDAFDNQSYRGTVQSVAVLPRQSDWMGSDIKVFETVVSIDEVVERVKPGMTAVVEIHVDRLKDVLSVPVQAVVEFDKNTWCYVSQGGHWERRKVELGKTNDKFVQVVSGLEVGEQVVLNPSAIVDDSIPAERLVSPDAGAPELPEAPQTEPKESAARVAETPPAGGGGRPRGRRPPPTTGG
jgi:RND family efflux transporter MFP subunit